MTLNNTQIIDADGHIIEDVGAIRDLMPEAYRADLANLPLFSPFPSADHLHSSTLVKLPEQAFDVSVDSDKWLAFLEDVGITSTVLYPTWGLGCGRIVSVDWAIDVCHAYNDWLHRAYLARNSRFKGMALIPLQSPATAAEELRRAVTELGMSGAILHSSGITQSHAGHERYLPVYEEANRLGCAIAFHGGQHEGFGMDDLSPFAPVHAIGHPFGQMISFGSIVFNGILDRFPQVRFAFLEAGVAWLLVCLERFDGSYAGFIPTDLRDRFLKLKGKEKVSDYICRHIDEGRIFIGCEGDELALADAVRIVGNKPFVYSTDFPHEVNNMTCKQEISELLENEALTDADKTAILSGNAERLYGL